MKHLGKYNVLGTSIAACDYAFLVRQIKLCLPKRKKIYIFPAATHPVTVEYLARRTNLEVFDYVVPDSQWLRWSLGFLYGVWLPDRVYGPELMLKICEQIEKSKVKVGLLGYKSSTLTKLVKVLNRRFPQLKIEVLRPYRKKEGNTVARQIISKRIKVLFMGLGSPHQEEITRTALSNLPLVVIPVGAAFDFISGQKAQAPAFMQKAGFEWLFRLIQEPKRLWRRYFIYGPLFVLFVLSQKLNNLLYPVWLWLQRVMAAILFVLLSPLLIVIALAIAVDSPGPVIFKQKRAGKKLKPFTIYKYRTMVEGAERLQDKLKDLNEADGPVFKIANDPRFTRIGKVISRPGFDELPQLVNVIKGEMALIGPRPLPVKEARQIFKEHIGRFSVLPGISSSWVVSGAHSLKFKRWMELDNLYVKYQSIGTDLKIIFQTVLLMVKSLTTFFKS